MAQTPYVRTSWFDYDRSRIWQHQITLSDGPSWIEGSPWITAIVVVILAFASPAAYMLVIRSSVWVASYFYHRYFKRDASDLAPNDEAAALNPNGENAHRINKDHGDYSRVGDIMWSSSGPDVAMWKLGSLAFAIAKNKGETAQRPSYIWKELILTICLILLTAACLTLFVCFAIGGMVSAGVISDTVVISNHPKCGVWVLDEEMETSVLSKFPQHYYTQEVEASDYAKRCFGAPQGTDGCNFFMVPELPVFQKDHASCPFSEDICLGDAFSLTTNFQSSKKLGINAPVGYLYSRTAICAPLKLDGYVATSKDGVIYEYQYGANGNFGNVTWRSLTDQYSSFSQYNMMTVSSLHDNWSPLPEFHQADDKEITLMFIQAQNVLYDEKRHDPIFPADSPVDPAERDKTPLYHNSDSRASVLACVDWKEICHPSGTPCYADIRKPEPESPDKRETVGYYMLLLALRKSSIGSALPMRGGSALDASSKLVGNLSTQLNKQQWKTEARSAFEASLARMQITLRDLVRGTAAEEPGFHNHIDSGMLDMCTSYKFRSTGWRHCSIAGLCILIGSAIAVYILGIEKEITPDAAEDDVADNGQHGQLYGTMNSGHARGNLPGPPHGNRPAVKTSLLAAFAVRWLCGIFDHIGQRLRRISFGRAGVDQARAEQGPGIDRTANAALAATINIDASSSLVISGNAQAQENIETADGSWERASLHHG